MMLNVFADVMAGICGNSTAVHPSGVFWAFCSEVIPVKVWDLAMPGRAKNAESTIVLMIDFLIVI